MKKIIKIILLLLLCPILFAFYGYQEVAAGTESYPLINSYWDAPPIIKVCKDLKISKSRVEKALDYWRRLGYTFNKVIYEDESISCAGKLLYGEVVITIPDQGFNYSNIAITRKTMRLPWIWIPGDDYTIEGMNTIVYATIFLQEKEVNKERVLEHEIGHALGWDHISRKYHLMNKSWENGGHDSAGLSYKRYKELYELIILIR